MPVLKIKKTDGAWQEVWGVAVDPSVSVPKSTTITLLADSWVGDAQPYSQAITISAATVNSKIDLLPTSSQILALQEADISLMVENDNGSLTCYALGGKPEEDYTIQALITEVTPV